MRFPAGMSHRSEMGFGVPWTWHADVPCPVQQMVTNPASGNRNNTDGALNNVTSNGNYWSAVPNNTNNGHNLNFNSGNVNPQNNNNRSNGFAVRPSQAFTNNSTLTITECRSILLKITNGNG